MERLRWGDVAFGTSGDDPTRHIEIRQARPRGLNAEAPKSGQERRPHLSRRLRNALAELYRARWEPGPADQIVKASYWGLSELVLRRVLRLAGLPHRTFQNLRATCSSLLKQWGIAPAYVRAMIGHKTDAVAREHYDRLDFTTYRAPEELRDGETPMDLFARVCVEPDADAVQPLGERVQARAGEQRQTPPRVPSPRKKAPKRQVVGWRPQRDSNPCCQKRKASNSKRLCPTRGLFFCLYLACSSKLMSSPALFLVCPRYA